MRIERSAGGVVYRRGQSGSIQVLVIKDSHDGWAFPKGRIGPDETPVQAARRETFEEVGLRKITLVKHLGKSEFWFTDRWEQSGQKVHKYIDHFLFEAETDSVPIPEGKGRVKETHWVPLAELSGIVTYSTLQPIVERVKHVLTHDE